MHLHYIPDVSIVTGPEMFNWWSKQRFHAGGLTFCLISQHGTLIKISICLGLVPGLLRALNLPDCWNQRQLRRVGCSQDTRGILLDQSGGSAGEGVNKTLSMNTAHHS